MSQKETNPTNNLYAVIMAGGVGSRFWPVSTPELPKQFHDLLGTGKSLLQHTFERLLAIIPAENILISTNLDYKELVLAQLPSVTQEQLVLEPVMRNTAPAILYATMKIATQNPTAQIMIAPSDHWIDREDIFIQNLQAAFAYTAKNDVLMTMGIVPTYPNTGYGYIQYEKTNEKFEKVIRFTEKPELARAKSFVESGDYLWNAGIFIWSAVSILRAFEKYVPQVFKIFSNQNAVYNHEKEAAFILENYPKAENISIDYAILEKANNVKVMPVDMGWNDLGTWGALYQKLTKDTAENAQVNVALYTEASKGNMIRTEKGKKVIIKGLNDMIVVDTPEYLVILPKSDEQEIKSLSKKI